GEKGGPGTAGDVDATPDAPPRVPFEAVDQEVDLALTVQLEGDLVEPRRAVLADAALFAKPQRGPPHRAKSASRMTQAAAMPVRPVRSQPRATCAREGPITPQPSSGRPLSASSGCGCPPGATELVPGASDGASTSMSIVT